MEPGNGNPYEQRLLSVYESCLEKGESQLGEKGLRILCEKLQLEERGTELISNLLQQKIPAKQTITFEEFRNGLVNLLDESRNSIENDEDELDDNNDSNLNENKVIEDTSIMTSLKYEEPTLLSTPIFRKLRNFQINGDVNLIINGGTLNDEPENQMLRDIFEKLDVDCDGLISFNEFVQLFHECRDHQGESKVIKTEWQDNSPDDSAIGKNHLTMIGPDHNGWIDSRSVINLWQVAGVSDAKNLLMDLNFSAAYINLSDLVNVLNEELKCLLLEPKDSAITKTHIDLFRATLILYQDEVRSINCLIDQLTKERDKLKIDVTEANERANLLATEIDENHSKLEKSRLEQIKILEAKHVESIKDLTLQFSCERDAQMATLKLLNEQLQQSQHEEQEIRGKLAEALNDYQALESDNQSLSEQISKLKMSNNQLLMQVQMLTAECDEAEASDDRQKEQVITLVDRIKKLQADNSLLKDHNDELTAELELLKVHKVPQKISPSGSFSDSEELNSVTECESLAKQAPELKVSVTDPGLQASSLEEASPGDPWQLPNSEIDHKKMSNIPQALASIITDLKSLAVDQKICTSDCQLRRNISHIISDFEGNEIVNNSSKLENNISKCDDKDEECEERASESLRDFVVNRTEKARILVVSSSPGTENVINNLDIINSPNKTSTLRDYPPRKGENQSDLPKVDDKINKNSTDCDVVDSPVKIDVEALKKDRDRLYQLLQEQETNHNNEKKILQEQCKKLENDLELLKNEYYQCEDYWAGKLEEERLIVEREQKEADEKLAELISKMAEYEEQFNTGDDNKSRLDGRLSPIEEKFNLEQQYADLECEFDDFRKHTKEILEEKDQELMELRDELKEFSKEKVDIGIQVSDDDTNKSRRMTSQSFNSYVYPNDCGVINNVGHLGINQKIFERGKLDKIAEHSISDNQFYNLPSKIPMHSNCCCQHHHSSLDELSRMQKIELHRLLNKQNSVKYNSRIRQREYLMKEFMDLNNCRSGNLCSSFEGSKLDVSCIKNLMIKVQILEEKKRNLQVNLKQLKQHTDKIIDCTWKQHSNEVANLQHVLKETQDSLATQVQINSMNMEKLAKSDLLLKDLYVENTYLKAKVDCLGERCHMLVNIDSKSTSV